MFCALNGATATPRRRSHRQIPATSALLPASEVVPATSSAPRTAAPYVEFPFPAPAAGAGGRARRRGVAYRGHVRFLLRPGWLALITTVTLFVIACYAVLAPWQFGREAERDAQQQAIDTASAIPPAPLAQVLPPDGVTAAVEWRQVTVTGTYLADAEAVVRLRVYDGKPAFEVLTPLRTDRRQVVAVDRGFATAESGAAVPAYAAPPSGEVTLAARLRVDETDPDHRPAVHRRRAPPALRHRRPRAGDGHRSADHAPATSRWPRISPACSRRCRSRPRRRRAPRRSRTSPTPCSG